jgi:DNA-binding MarR family transcriptional regulator
MAKRSKQLNAEIADALAKGSGHASATVRDWGKLVDKLSQQLHTAIAGALVKEGGGVSTHPGLAQTTARGIIAQELKSARAGFKAARAAEKATKATKPTNVTGANLGMLKAIVVQYRGGEFPRGYHAANKHIQRCIAGGLVELIDSNGDVTNQIFKGKRLRLTPTGRELVADLIITDIGSRESWTPKDLIIVPGLSASERAKVVAAAVAEHAAATQRLEETLANLRR